MDLTSPEDIDKCFQQLTVADEVKTALRNYNAVVWQGIDWFLNWLRTVGKDFFSQKVATLPAIGPSAELIGTTITDLLFVVVNNFGQYLRLSIRSPSLWQILHVTAAKEWESNAGQGVVEQAKAYGRRMAINYLEVIHQCLTRGIKVHGLEVSEEDKEKITNELDNLLQKNK